MPVNHQVKFEYQSPDQKPFLKLRCYGQFGDISPVDGNDLLDPTIRSVADQISLKGGPLRRLTNLFFAF